MTAPWRIELLGGLSLVREDQVINRFQTRKTAALLAYLAFHCDKITSREVLAELLWPDTDPDAARNSLRVALTSLRRQLEPPGIPAGALLFSDRTSIHLNPAACVTDVADFENALHQECIVTNNTEKMQALLVAVTAYKGPLLPGWYEEWVDTEQSRLSEQYASALHRLTTLLFQMGDNERALDFARRAVQADPLREESHRHILRLYAAMGNPSAAREQYQRLEATFQKELQAVPSETTRELIKKIESGMFAETSRANGKTLPDSTPLPVDGMQFHFATASIAARTEVPDAKGGSSIPLQFTRFFGRDEEMTWLSDFFHPQAAAGDRPRLVTLTGPGGIGKTRLAIVLATHLRDTAVAYAGRIWVVSLADLTEVTQIAPTMLATLNHSVDPKISPSAQIFERLSAFPAFLVLDNMEQFAENGADFVRTLLEKLPQLRLLVTSRHRLEIEGEREFPVSPLPAPSAEHLPVVPEEIVDVPSVALFVDRVQALRPDFQITPRNASAIATLCRRLDGLPLAIELVAAWARLLTPAQMVERLSHRFKLLISERRDISPRHRSLRAVMDESWRLLPDTLGSFLEKLTIFRGGGTLAAVQAVCTNESGDVLEKLGLLQQHSLVFLEETESGIRFRMLESVRDYAEEKNEREFPRQLHDVHATYYSEYAASLVTCLEGPQAEAFQGILEKDHENFRSALLHALQANLSDTALHLVTALWRFWCVKGYAEEGLGFLEAVLEQSVSGGMESTFLHVIARNGAGRLALSMGKMRRASEHFRKGLDILENLPVRGGESLTAITLTNWGIAASACGDYDTASAAYGQLAKFMETQSDLWASAYALGGLGSVRRASQDEAGAHTAFAEGFRLRELWGDSWCAGKSGQMWDSEDLSSKSTQVSSKSGLADSYLGLGHIAAEQGDYAAATELLNEALAAYRAHGDGSGCALVWERIAVVAARRNDWAKAEEAADKCLILRYENHAAAPVIAFTKHLQQAALHQKWPLDTFTNTHFYDEKTLTL